MIGFFSPKLKKEEEKENTTCRERCAQSLVRQNCSSNNVVEPVAITSLVLDAVFGHATEGVNRTSATDSCAIFYPT